MDCSDALIDALPKADLHVHLEGSLEPELVIELARRNDLSVPWSGADELRAAYRFEDLESFLALYWTGCLVLVRERDFYDMTMAYLRRVRQDNVLHAEMFLSPQNFTPRGIDIATVMTGVLRACDDARAQLGMTTGLMIIAQRQRPESDALGLLEQVLPWSDRIVAFGLGGPENGYPPSRFPRFFRACRDKGFKIVMHAGEEGPVSYVREAVDLFAADRIDHGNACVNDPALIREIAARRIPLTLCPLSNLRLNLVRDLAAHPLKMLLDQGVKVTVNTDDPSYFGGYVNDNYKACRTPLHLNEAEIVALVRNSFTSAFLPEEEKQRYLGLVDECVRTRCGE